VVVVTEVVTVQEIVVEKVVVGAEVGTARGMDHAVVLVITVASIVVMDLVHVVGMVLTVKIPRILEMVDHHHQEIIMTLVVIAILETITGLLQTTVTDLATVGKDLQLKDILVPIIIILMVNPDGNIETMVATANRKIGVTRVYVTINLV
jgi:hypothetical protein